MAELRPLRVMHEYELRLRHYRRATNLREPVVVEKALSKMHDAFWAMNRDEREMARLKAPAELQRFLSVKKSPTLLSPPSLAKPAFVVPLADTSKVAHLQGATTLAEAQAKLVASGFVESAPGLFARGVERIETRHMMFANLPAIDVRLGRGEHAPRFGVLVGGALVSADAFRVMEAARDKELANFAAGMAHASLQDRVPTTAQAIKHLSLLGSDPLRRSNRIADLQATRERIEEIVPKIIALRKLGKRFMIYVDGHDAAGKTSLAETLVKALSAAGYNDIAHISFKGRTPEEKAEDPLARYIRGMSNNPGVLVVDRGPAGDAVYGEVEANYVAGWEAFERELQQHGIIALKFCLSADRDRQAVTFGRRWARYVLAQKLLQRSDLTTEQRAELQNYTGISTNDIPGFANEQTVKTGFDGFATRNAGVHPWYFIDTTHRALGRDDGLDALDARLDEAFREAHAAQTLPR